MRKLTEVKPVVSCVSVGHNAICRVVVVVVKTGALYEVEQVVKRLALRVGFVFLGVFVGVYIIGRSGALVATGVLGQMWLKQLSCKG